MITTAGGCPTIDAARNSAIRGSAQAVSGANATTETDACVDRLQRRFHLTVNVQLPICRCCKRRSNIVRQRQSCMIVTRAGALLDAQSGSVAEVFCFAAAYNRIRR